MKLYHGTNAAYLDNIKNNGLVPRAQSKNKGNWSHTVASSRDAVYLTDAYAWHFAASATGKTEIGLILEIDSIWLDPERLCPDEDFLEQSTRRQSGNGFADPEWSMEKRTRHYRKIARHNPSLSQASLEALGTAAYYGTIPWSAVSRYVLLDWSKINIMTKIQAVDSMVSIMNYRFLSDRHRAFTKWFFGDPVTLPEFAGQMFPLDSDNVENELSELLRKRKEAVEKQMIDRSGIEVITIDKPDRSRHLSWDIGDVEHLG